MINFEKMDKTLYLYLKVFLIKFHLLFGKFSNKKFSSIYSCGFIVSIQINEIHFFKINKYYFLLTIILFMFLIIKFFYYE